MSRQAREENGIDPQPVVMFWKDFTLQDALYLGFCATFIIITRAMPGPSSNSNGVGR